MKKFTLLFRSRRGLAIEGAVTDERWPGWIKDLDARGLVANPGQPLLSTGRLIEGLGHDLLTTSFVDLNDMIKGFIVLTAHDLDEAVEISRGCPIFDEGGSVEVRPVLQPDR